MNGLDWVSRIPYLASRISYSIYISFVLAHTHTISSCIAWVIEGRFAQQISWEQGALLEAQRLVFSFGYETLSLSEETLPPSSLAS
jgi:hypothetical protein